MNSIPPRSERSLLTHDDWHGGSHPRVLTDPVIVCVLRTATCRTVYLKTDHTTRISGGHSTRVWLTWCALVCAEVPATITVIFAQCGLVVHTYHHDSCRTFPPNTWFAWWHFVQLSCLCCSAVVRLVVWSCWEHHTTMMCARRALSEGENHMVVVLPFRRLRRGPSHDQRYICIVWSCGTHE